MNILLLESRVDAYTGSTCYDAVYDMDNSHSELTKILKDYAGAEVTLHSEADLDTFRVSTLFYQNKPIQPGLINNDFFSYIIGIGTQSFKGNIIIYDTENKSYNNLKLRTEIDYPVCSVDHNELIKTFKKLLAESVPARNSTPQVELITKRPAPRTTPVAKRTTKQNSVKNREAIAVIIGGKNYSKNNSDVPDVDYALNDAEQIYQYVVDVLGYREGNIIYLKDPSQADFTSTFGSPMSPKGKLYDWVRPGKSDVFVYYSGHGAPSLSNGQGYLLPVDADPQRVELTGFPLETLYKNLSQIPARSMTVVVDACFSGSSQSGTVVRNASSISLRQTKATNFLPKGAVLTATGSGEVASWDASAKQGLFTRYFLEGVYGKADGKAFGNGDGKVTLGELKAYLEDEVTYYARREYGREQHPQVSGASSMTLSDLSYGQ